MCRKSILGMFQVRNITNLEMLQLQTEVFGKNRLEFVEDSTCKVFEGEVLDL